MNEIGFQLFCTVLFVKSVIIFAIALSSKTQLSRQSASEIEFAFRFALFGGVIVVFTSLMGVEVFRLALPERWLISAESIIESIINSWLFLVMLCVYALRSLQKFLVLVTGVLRLYYGLPAQNKLVDKRVQEKLELARSQLVLNYRVEVYLTDDCVSPHTWGVFRPRIILPKQALAWSDEKIKLILLHELAHIKRKDWLVALCIKFFDCVFWVVPGFSRLRKDVELLREISCDDRVLQKTNKPETYAEGLLSLQSLISGGHAIKPVENAFNHNDLYLRVEAILDCSRNREEIGFFKRCVFFIGYLCFTLMLASVELSPTLPSSHAFSDRDVLVGVVGESTESNQKRAPNEEFLRRRVKQLEQQAEPNRIQREGAEAIASVDRFSKALVSSPEIHHQVDIAVDQPSRIVMLISIPVPEYPRRAIDKEKQFQTRVLFDINKEKQITNVRFEKTASYAAD